MLDKEQIVQFVWMTFRQLGSGYAQKITLDDLRKLYYPTLDGMRQFLLDVEDWKHRAERKRHGYPY